ncbi:hypothetical protein ACWCRD_17560 [Streptomyces sp. NPDC002092]
MSIMRELALDTAGPTVRRPESGRAVSTDQEAAADSLPQHHDNTS